MADNSLDVAFCRALLAQVMPDVKANTTPAQRKAAWVYGYRVSGRQAGSWEFHGPDDFYWHGAAANAYDARYHGWSAWLAKYHPETGRGE